MSLQAKSNKLDILNGSIWNKLPLYAIPVAATRILEQLFNASDIAIVGNFASTDRTVAIAAVGANSPVIGVILNLFIGLSLGTNVVIAMPLEEMMSMRRKKPYILPFWLLFWQVSLLPCLENG